MKKVLSYEFGNLKILINFYDKVLNSEAIEILLPSMKQFLITSLKRDICAKICSFTDGIRVCDKETMTIDQLGVPNNLPPNVKKYEYRKFPSFPEKLKEIYCSNDYKKITKYRNTTLSHAQKNRYKESDVKEDGSYSIERDDSYETNVTIEMIKGIMLKIEDAFINLSVENNTGMGLTSGLIEPFNMYELELLLKKALLFDRLIETKLIKYIDSIWPVPERNNITIKEIKQLNISDYFNL